MIVIGYGLNSDDEHITNLLRERIRNGKKVLWFHHTDADKENVKKLLGINSISDTEFENQLIEILK